MPLIQVRAALAQSSCQSLLSDNMIESASFWLEDVDTIHFIACREPADDRSQIWQ